MFAREATLRNERAVAARIPVVSEIGLHGEQWERLLEGARYAAVGRLLRSLMHELSTPLAAIALRVESLERLALGTEASAAASDKARRYLKAMSEECQRSREILATIREFVGPSEAGSASVDLAALCRGAARLVAHEAMRKQVEVEVVALELPPLAGQRHRLAQAVLALVTNAVDACPPGGKVRLEVVRGVDEVSVAVEDEGDGLAEAVRTHLFEPFASSRPPAEGLGMGLAACRAIAEGHGGSLDHGPRPGRGTRFVLRLPSVQPATPGGKRHVA